LAKDLAGDADSRGIRRRLEFIDSVQGEYTAGFRCAMRGRQPILVDHVDAENSQRIDVADARRPFATVWLGRLRLPQQRRCALLVGQHEEPGGVAEHSDIPGVVTRLFDPPHRCLPVPVRVGQRMTLGIDRRLGQRAGLGVGVVFDQPQDVAAPRFDYDLARVDPRRTAEIETKQPGPRRKIVRLVLEPGLDAFGIGLGQRISFARKPGGRRGAWALRQGWCQLQREKRNTQDCGGERRSGRAARLASSILRTLSYFILRMHEKSPFVA
jgi:hypothetical protein